MGTKKNGRAPLPREERARLGLAPVFGSIHHDWRAHSSPEGRHHHQRFIAEKRVRLVMAPWIHEDGLVVKACFRFQDSGFRG